MRHFKQANKSFFDDLAAYINTYMALRSEEHTEVFEQAMEAADDYYERSAALPRFASPAPRAKAPQMCGGAIVLPEKQPTFQQSLFALIDEKGMKDSAVYKKADVDRRLFSKIRADAAYHPSKSTAIKLCLALELDMVSAEELLEKAGYCLSLSDTADLVVRYCIEHKIYKLLEVNEALDYFGQEIL